MQNEQAWQMSGLLTLAESMYKLAKRVILTERAETNDNARRRDERLNKSMQNDGTSDRRIYVPSGLRLASKVRRSFGRLWLGQDDTSALFTFR